MLFVQQAVVFLLLSYFGEEAVPVALCTVQVLLQLPVVAVQVLVTEVNIKVKLLIDGRSQSKTIN